MNDEMQFSDFEAEYQLSLSINKTFQEQISLIMKKKHWNSSVFTEKTGLDYMTYNRVMQGKNLEIKTVISRCLGLKLNIGITQELLKLKGHALSPVDRVHIAYSYLIENYKNMDIEQANELLSDWGIEKKHFLGSQSRDI